MSGIATTLRHWITTLAERHSDTGLESIHHKLDKWLLGEAHRQLGARKAPGIDGETKTEYGRDLSARVDALVDRVRSQTYRAPPVRRVEIPKPDGSLRPLGIPTYEDKVLQRAFVMLVEPVLEREFRDRKGRGCHQAVRAVDRAICEGCHWIIELDIRKYFESIPHQALREMFRRRIKDGALNRLVLGWLKAGALLEGEWEQSEEGTPQGGNVSPLLANLYLHDTLDAWFEDEVKPRLKGAAHLVRYADDAVLCFQREEDAARVLAVLAKRLAKYGLTMHPDKTRLVDFRPPLQGQADRQPRSFSFLGFAFYWGKGRKGRLVPKVKTDRQRYRRALRAMAEWCREHRHDPLKEQQQRLKAKIDGHTGYYGVSHNFPSLMRFRRSVERLWLKWINRRGSPRAITWEQLRGWLERGPWAQLKIKHSLFEARTPQLRLRLM